MMRDSKTFTWLVNDVKGPVLSDMSSFPGLRSVYRGRKLIVIGKEMFGGLGSLVIWWFLLLLLFYS